MCACVLVHVCASGRVYEHMTNSQREGVEKDREEREREREREGEREIGKRKLLKHI